MKATRTKRQGAKVLVHDRSSVRCERPDPEPIAMVDNNLDDLRNPVRDAMHVDSRNSVPPSFVDELREPLAIRCAARAADPGRGDGCTTPPAKASSRNVFAIASTSSSRLERLRPAGFHHCSVAADKLPHVVQVIRHDAMRNLEKRHQRWLNARLLCGSRRGSSSAPIRTPS